ncbi:MAG: serine hydrolase domain-containing protein, partial [Acidimicrobiales bacterium]
MAVLLAMVLVAVGCSSDPGDEGAADYLQRADQCEPNMGAALDAWGDQGYSGAIAVLGDDRHCAIGIGLADQATGRPVTAGTTFSIGSITKAVTAAAVLDLVDQGRIALDDTAGQHVDGLTGAVNDLTIRNLLVHTSGLTGYHGRDHVALSKSEAIDAISQLDISFEQGTDYSYTNAGYTLLALIVEAVSDQGYRQYLVDEILRDGSDLPIGGFWDGEPAGAEPRAVGYLAGGVPGELGDFAGPHWALDGNGGVAMTVLEMAVWTRALFSGKILSEEATEQLTTIRKRVAGGEYELPGWVELPPQIIGERLILASGGGGSIGHLMDVAWLPDTGRVIAVAQNATSRNVNDLLLNIADALVTGTGVPTPAPIAEVDPAVVADMVGSYRLDDGTAGPDRRPASTIEVAIDDVDPRGLLVTAGGPAAITALFPVPAGFE